MTMVIKKSLIKKDVPSTFIDDSKYTWNSLLGNTFYRIHRLEVKPDILAIEFLEYWSRTLSMSKKKIGVHLQFPYQVSVNFNSLFILKIGTV